MCDGDGSGIKRDNLVTVRLFLTGWLQVILVACNTYQIAHKHLVGATVVGFLISLVWTLNVRGAAMGNWTDRLAYSAGACLGTLSGILLMEFLYGAA